MNCSAGATEGAQTACEHIAVDIERAIANVEAAAITPVGCAHGQRAVSEIQTSVIGECCGIDGQRLPHRVGSDRAVVNDRGSVVI